jgi:4-amino-4-deoxy-L-arabinose transferase-like glycosyltransferase
MKLSDMQASRKSLVTYGMLIVILLVACFAISFRIGSQSVWFDEGWSAYAAGQPDIVQAANADATNPPLYYMLLHITTRFVGNSEFGLRLLSLWCALLTIVVTYALGRRLAGRQAGLWGAAAAVALPLLWWAGREARMYTLLALLASLAAYALARLLDGRARRRWPWWGLLASCELGLLYAHNTGPVAFVWVNAVVVLAWVMRRRASLPDWRIWLVVQAVVAAAWAPYFVTRFLLLPEANAAVTSTTSLDLAGLVTAWAAFWIVPFERLSLGGENASMTLALFVLCIGGLALGSRRLAWAGLHALLWAAGILLGLLVLGNEFHGRYLVVAAPFVALLLGGVLGLLAGSRGSRRGNARFALAVIALSMLAFGQMSYGWDENAFGHDDARAMVRHYAETLSDEDTVIAWSYADRYELAYYWEREGATARRVTLPEGAGLETIAPLLPASGDVALNVWYTQRADYRGMMPCLLASGTTELPVETSVRGMTSLLFRQPSLRLPDNVDTAIEVLGTDRLIGRLTAYGRLVSGTADSAMCVPVALLLTGPTADELKAALVVRDETGREIVTATGVFATPDQRTSQSARPDELLEAWVLLRLPPGTPPGRYTVALRVFSEDAMPIGYTLRGGDVRGRDSVLGDLELVPGAVWSGHADVGEIPTDAPLTLISAQTEQAASFRPGDRVTVLLTWSGAAGQGALPELVLRARDRDYSVMISSAIAQHDDFTREVRTFLVPADAPPGRYALLGSVGATLAELEVIDDPINTVLPPMDAEVNVVFPGVGELVGFRLESPLSVSENPRITLVWRGIGAISEQPLTVFVQMLDAAGRVLAQSDAQPAAGARPTTGWRDGEIILDAHELRYNALAVPGRVWLIAGLYDPVSFERASTANGGDSAMLMESVPLMN